jgi:FlaA1/EpsC-like NDP-sugar epimerase
MVLSKLTPTLYATATSLTRRQKAVILMTVDVLLVPLSLWLTAAVEGAAYRIAIAADLHMFIALATVMSIAGLVFSLMLGLPRIKLNAYEQSGVQRTAAYAALVGFVGIIGLYLFFDGRVGPRTMVIFTMILVIVSVSTRISLRSILIWLYQRGHTRQRVLIYGAGQTGVQLASALHTDDAVWPVAFVDDNKTLHNIMVAGLPVYSPVRIRTLIKEMQIDRVVLAMPSISRPKQARLARSLKDLGCDVSALPSFATLVGKGNLIDRIHPVNPSDFLGREGLESDLHGLCDIYKGRTVLITGAGGSIGSELTRQILACRPAKVVLFETSEYALYQLDHELNYLGVHEKSIEIIPVLGSVTDERAVRRTIAHHKVDIILHAAAYKHVPMVECNRLEGLRNNVIGTKIVAEAARDAKVSYFILISTDKAVHPTNIMGASKRLAELFVQDMATQGLTTRFGIVRFGNVLGSSGSVVPLFEEQIARGGPVTLTHQEVSRYFMTLAEASRLVLLAGNYAKNEDNHGEVFLLDMGAPVPIRNLARQMIEAAGYSVCDDKNPTGDIEIVITGLRPGEKLHEELAMHGHEVRKTDHPKIMRIEESQLSEIEVATAMRALTRAIESDDAKAATDLISRWVAPSYRETQPLQDIPAQDLSNVTRLDTNSSA